MLTHPNIDPVMLSLGPIEVHWYGMMYLLGFTLALVLGFWRARSKDYPFTALQVESLIFHGAIGLILGARIGYMLFYNFQQVLNDPLSLFKIWQGGMSYHGGAIGVTIAMWIYCRRWGKRFLESTDFMLPLAPLGLCAGRIGNFINGELWGRVTDLPWGMVFANGGPLPRHPSQLYEAALEGLLLFIIVWFYSRTPRPMGSVSGVFLSLYGIMRFSVEFLREPDAHIGFLAYDWLTMGQILSIPMVIAGCALILYAHIKHRREPLMEP